MKAAIAAVVAGAIALFSTQGHAQTISKDEYRDAVLVLFDQFMRMKQDGVFMDAAMVKQLKAAKYEFPNTIRGDNPPGGFFARPPGSDWLKRVQALPDTGHKLVCFDIPALPSGSGVCGFDLMQLHSEILSPERIHVLDAIAAKFQLASICHRNPGACAPPGAEAGAPDECRPLFLALVKTVGAMVRKGDEAQNVAMDGLDRGRRINADDYGLLSDRLFQLLGWQTDMVAKLNEAVTCLDKQS